MLEVVTLDSFGVMIVGMYLLQGKLDEYIFEYKAPSKAVLEYAK
jgi:hypothetical protein